MRILQLSVHYPPNIGGVETHLNDLVKELVAGSNEVFVLTYLPLTVKVKASVWETGKNLTILRLPWIAGLFYKFVKNPILEFLYLAPPLIFVTPFVLALVRPEVVHTHGLIAGFVGTFWGKLFGIKTITTTHSVYHFPESGIYRFFSKWIFESSSKVLTLSNESKKELIKLGIEKDKVQVFTYWIDLDKFHKIKNAKEKVGWENKFVVLYLGRLVEEKGILVLLESLKDWNKNIFLAIVGTGPLESRIKDCESRSKNLFFLGKIDNEELPLYYSASDVTIVPSIHDEGFGRIILESLACGIPVIGSNRGAIPEAMDETVGVLININTKNIKEKVNYLYGHLKYLSRLGTQGRIFAERRYSEENLKLILDTYI